MTRAYRIGAAARRAGLSQAVLRAWERRYRVLAPARTPGGHRVYSERDIALLRRLRQLTRDGIAIREAAALAAGPSRGGHGARPSGPQLERRRHGMLAAAARLEQNVIECVLDAALAILSPLQVYEDLIVRLEGAVGERASRGTPGRAQQRLVSQVVRARLLGYLRSARGRTRGQVVCACLPDEEHDLGLLGAARRFRAAAFRVTFLGARTPVEHVARRLRAAVVALACVHDPGATTCVRAPACWWSTMPRRGAGCWSRVRPGSMGQVYDGIDDRVAGFLRAQRMFFVATAPSGADGHVNLSPKGLDTFAVLDARTVAYLDLTGSGAETIAHVRQNGRITLGFVAFEGPPRIVRLHGRGTVVVAGDPAFEDLVARFPAQLGTRSVIRVAVERVADSCGYAVPEYAFVRDRRQLVDWAARKGPDGLRAYRAQNNGTSIDGLPALDGSRG